MYFFWYFKKILLRIKLDNTRVTRPNNRILTQGSIKKKQSTKKQETKYRQNYIDHKTEAKINKN